MNILESLEQLDVSEECLNDILNIVEKLVEIHNLINKDNGESEYTSKGTPKRELHLKATKAQEAAAEQYAKERNRGSFGRAQDRAEYMDRMKGEDTKEYIGKYTTYTKQFPHSVGVRTGYKPRKYDKLFRYRIAREEGKPVKGTEQMYDKMYDN